VFGLAAVFVWHLRVLPVTPQRQNGPCRSIRKPAANLSATESRPTPAILSAASTKASEAMGQTAASPAAFSEKRRDCRRAPNERKKKNLLVVRYHGSGQKKAHPFHRATWTWSKPARGRLVPWIPFQFIEKDGFFYGRGTQEHEGRRHESGSKNISFA